MGWSYDNTLPTAKDQVRFLVQDTDSTEQLAQDEEINFALSQSGQNVYEGSAIVCDAIALNFARRVSLSGKVVDDNKSRAEQYAQMAKDYRQQAKTKRVLTVFAGGTSVADKDARASDPDRVRPAFDVNLHASSSTRASLSEKC